MRFLVPALIVCLASASEAAVTATGRNWRISIDGITCETAASRVTLEMRIHYLGPPGLVEAPVNQLVDGDGRQFAPRSLVWRGGSKPLAAWLSAGGLKNLQAKETGQLQFRFEVGEGTQALSLEFGDIKAFSLTRKRGAAGRGLCDSLLSPGQLQATRANRTARSDAAPGFRVYRSVYPCRPPSRGAWRTIEGQYPPYLPEWLLVFGHAFLPNTRQVELPMGKADAQSYAYTGTEELDAIESAARRAIMEDFAGYAPSLRTAQDGLSKYYAFNWGAQTAPSGNRIYSIGIYAVRTCPG